MRRRELLAGAAALPLALGGRVAGAHAQSRADAGYFSGAQRLAMTTELAYRQAAASGRLDDGLARTARRFARLEAEHAGALRTAVEALGVLQPSPPTAVRGLEPDAGREDFLRVAIRLEELALGRAQAAVRQLEEPELLAIVAQILACDAQQLAVLRAASGRAPVTEAFETGRR